MVAINNTAKGSKKELEVKKILERDGFTVEKVRNIPFQKTHDYFGCADLLASRHDCFRFIAITDKNHKSRAIKKLRGFTNHPKFIQKEVWYYDKEGNWYKEVNNEPEKIIYKKREKKESQGRCLL